MNDTINVLQARLMLAPATCGLDILAAATNTKCPVCGSFMPVAKTSIRQIKTMTFGQIEVSEQHRWCPGGCRDDDEQLVHHRSQHLSYLIKPGCNIGYDVECYIGRRMFLENMQAVEVHGEILKRGFQISLSEVFHLADKFLDHLESVHIDNAEKLKKAMMKAGGYVAHIDATCDKGRGCTFVVLSGWDGWALISGRVETEHHDLITPYLQQAIDMFGAPVGFVRDMGGAMRKAIDSTKMPPGAKPLELVCHYHFGKDIGKDILNHWHDELMSLFRKSKLKKKLQDYIQSLSDALKGQSIQKMVAEWAKSGEARIPAGNEGIAVIRSLAQKILDYNHDESMKKFPFTRPYLELYDRCCYVYIKLADEVKSGRHSNKIEKYLLRFQNILHPIISSSDIKIYADIVREKAKVFDRLRSILRLDSDDGCIAKAGEVALDAAILVSMENIFNEFINEIKEEHKTSTNAFVKKAIETILEHVDEHGEYLWGHIVSMLTLDGKVINNYIFRTNNVLECFFRPVKRNIRRREGRENIGYSLEHTKASICYIGNLSSQKYLDIVYDGSLDNLQYKFALYDIANKSKQKDTKNLDVASRGSLSSADKRIIRRPYYTKKIVGL